MLNLKKIINFNNMKILTESRMNVIIILLIFLIGLTFFIGFANVHGTSMLPNYKSGELVFVNKMRGFTSDFKYHDVVIVNAKHTEVNKYLIKRIIGLPGDKIEIKSGKIYVNGNELDESSINISYTSGQTSITLKEKEYFVLGDNRNNSLDSRVIGAVPEDKIIGVVGGKVISKGVNNE